MKRIIEKTKVKKLEINIKKLLQNLIMIFLRLFHNYMKSFQMEFSTLIKNMKIIKLKLNEIISNLR